MSEAEDVQFHVKFVINESKTKVLFAEAGSDFADVLLLPSYAIGNGCGSPR